MTFDDQDVCEWVNVSSGTDPPGQRAIIRCSLCSFAMQRMS